VRAYRPSARSDDAARQPEGYPQPIEGAERRDLDPAVRAPHKAPWNRGGPSPSWFRGAPRAMHDRILIVDFGSQVTQLIARRVREEKVYCEIAPFQRAAEAFTALAPKGVILSGGPASVLDPDAPLAPESIYRSGVPVLGICYGSHAGHGAVRGGLAQG
jgi:carbamoylphosphate synthase small subunit